NNVSKPSQGLPYISPPTSRKQQVYKEQIPEDKPFDDDGIFFVPLLRDVFNLDIADFMSQVSIEERPVTISLVPTTFRLLSHLGYEANRIASHYNFDIICFFSLNPELLYATQENKEVTAKVIVAYPSIPIAKLEFPCEMYRNTLEIIGWDVHNDEYLSPIYSRGYSRVFTSEDSTNGADPVFILTCLQGASRDGRTIDFSCLSNDAETLVDRLKAYAPGLAK
ncbi:hypothetical protein V8C42DRAFT_339059, partial [Trichoderma barbatum]